MSQSLLAIITYHWHLWTIVNHYWLLLIIINHHQPSLRHYQPSLIILNHPYITITNHQPSFHHHKVSFHYHWTTQSGCEASVTISRPLIQDRLRLALRERWPRFFVKNGDCDWLLLAVNLSIRMVNWLFSGGKWWQNHGERMVKNSEIHQVTNVC